MRPVMLLIVSYVVSLTMGGCQVKPPTVADTTKASTMRTVAVGNPEENTAFAAILASTLGGDAGMIMIRQMDVTAQAIGKAELTGARVMRLAEGVKVTINPAAMFTRNTAALSADGKASLLRLAMLLREYRETDIIVEGHTDGKGSPETNQKLSAKRALAVAEYLESQSISPERIKARGYGDRQPLFSNETPEGRKQNRRVEIVIVGNDSMKEQAKKLVAQRQ